MTDKIFRPNMPKLVGIDGKVEAEEEEKQPSNFVIITDTQTIEINGFLVVTSAFVAIMDTEDEIALVVPMVSLKTVRRVEPVAGVA